jgi:hypothetical protein
MGRRSCQEQSRPCTVGLGEGVEIATTIGLPLKHGAIRGEAATNS